MSQLQSGIVSFVCLLGLTAFCSYIGDDDVVYELFDRKPTPREAIIRVRWVLLKAATSIFGGVVLATAILELLKAFDLVLPSVNEAVLFAVMCMAIVSLLIGGLQNQIRRLRGRPPRPLIDRKIWKKNIGQWRGKW